MALTIPSISLNFDASSLAYLENEISGIEETFLLLIISALKNNNKEICQKAVKFITPDMISDERLKDIYQNILQNPDIKTITTKLNGSKAVLANLLQKSSAKNIYVDENVLFSIIEQLKEIYAKKQAISKLKYLDKCSSLDRLFLTIDSLKEEITQIYKIDESVHPVLMGALEPEDLEQDIKWLIPDILFPQSINVFYGPPSHGKSILALTIGIELLRRNLINHLIYLDGDNPLVILQYRKIGKILKEFNRKEKKIIYHNISGAEIMQRYLENLVNFPGNNLIIIDSLKDLAGNLNLNDQKDSTYLQTLIQRARNGSKTINQNTIIVLHHENKAKGAKGNSIFLDGADCAYQFNFILKKNNSLYLRLSNKKTRLPVKPSVYFKIYLEEYRLFQILNKDLHDISIKPEDKVHVFAILSYLQKKYDMGIKKISIKELSEKLNISERRLKKLGKEYNLLWSLDNNNFTLIFKHSETEIDLWNSSEISEKNLIFN